MRILMYPIIVSLLLASESPAVTWYIQPDGGGDAPTIQAGLDRSSPGDTVLVAAGTYEENLTMRTGRILRSESGPNATVLRPGALGSVIVCDGIGPPARIQGFTIRNGLAYMGGGILVRQSQLVIEGNILKYNQCDTDGRGGALYIRECYPGSIVQGNLFHDNAGYIGGAICSDAGDHSSFLRNTIVDNNATHAGGFIAYNECQDLFALNIVAANNASSGGGVYVHSTSQCDITCNDVWDNHPDNYHGWDWTGTGGNISVDPLFCDPDEHDFALSDDSPCLGSATCEAMGAFGIGCGPAAVPVGAVGAETLVHVRPNPFLDRCEIRFRLVQPGAVDLVITDVAGRRVERTRLVGLGAGEHAWSWSGSDDQGRPVAPGVYFLSVRANGVRATRPVVRTR